MVRAKFLCGFLVKPGMTLLFATLLILALPGAAWPQAATRTINTALTDGAGATITSTEIAATGIWVDDNGTSSHVDITIASTISLTGDSSDGVLIEYSAGAVTINVSSTITASGASFYAIRNEDDGFDFVPLTLDLQQGATISGDIQTGDRANSVSLVGNAQVDGEVELQGGDDTLTLTGSTLRLASATFDLGVGTDTLNLAGNIVVDAARFGTFINWENLRLRNTAQLTANISINSTDTHTFTLSDDAVLTGSIETRGTSTDSVSLSDKARVTGSVETFGDGSNPISLSGSATIGGQVDTGAGDDTIILRGSATIGLRLYGRNSSDHLNYSAYGSAVTVVLFGSDLGKGFNASSATGITNGFSGINRLTGSANNDSLTGYDTDATWALNGNANESFYALGAGTDSQGKPFTRNLKFSGFENLTGGGNNDTFLVRAAHSGNLAGGNDLFVLNAKLSGSLSGAAGGDTFNINANYNGAITTAGDGIRAVTLRDVVPNLNLQVGSISMVGESAYAVRLENTSAGGVEVAGGGISTSGLVAVANRGKLSYAISDVAGSSGTTILISGGTIRTSGLWANAINLQGDLGRITFSGGRIEVQHERAAGIQLSEPKAVLRLEAGTITTAGDGADGLRAYATRPDSSALKNTDIQMFGGTINAAGAGIRIGDGGSPPTVDNEIILTISSQVNGSQFNGSIDALAAQNLTIDLQQGANLSSYLNLGSGDDNLTLSGADDPATPANEAAQANGNIFLNQGDDVVRLRGDARVTGFIQVRGTSGQYTLENNARVVSSGGADAIQGASVWTA